MTNSTGSDSTLVDAGTMQYVHSDSGMCVYAWSENSAAQMAWMLVIKILYPMLLLLFYC